MNNRDIINEINLNDFVKVVKRWYPPFYLSLFHEGYMSKRIFRSFFGFSYNINDKICVDNDYYYPKYHLINFAEKIAKILFRDAAYFKKIKKETLKREKQLMTATKKDFETYCRNYSNYMPTLALYFVCDELIETRVRELLEKKTKEVDKLMHYLTLPFQDTLNIKEKVDLLKTRSIKKHLEKYGWMRSRYGYITPYKESMFKVLFKTLKNEQFKIHYAQEKKQIKEAIQKAKNLLGKKDQHIIDVMQFFIYYRTQRTDIMNYVSYLVAPTLKKYARAKGLTYKELLFCTHEELTKDLFNKKELKSRMKSFSIIVKNHIHIFTGKDDKMIKRIFKLNESHEKEIKGKAAFRGKVTGKVKVINLTDDLKKIKKGDILVASMTTPEMVLAMQKAAAFVTNEGGITCHAAIIAREMKKPCVICTKIATQVLKDGQLVEVDANKGIVKIIKNEKRK